LIVAESSEAHRLEAREPSLRPVIGVTGLGLMAVNVVIGAGIFGLPGLVAALVGPAALIAYLVVTVLILLVGLCFAEVGSRVTGAGGLYAYARVSFGPVVGGIAGTLIWAANSVVPNAAVANILVDTLAAAMPEFGGAASRVIVLVCVYSLLALVNMRAAHDGTRLSALLCIIKLLPLAALVAAGLFAVHAENLHWTGTPSAASLGQSCVLVFYAFMGTEGALTASGEVINPARTVPRAIVLALTIVATLFIGLQLVAQGVLGANLAVSKAPIVDAALAVFGPWGGRLTVVAILLSTTGFLAADVLSSPRILHALAEQGQLPRVLASVHSKFGTPAISIATYAFLCALVAWTGSFRELVIVASSGTLLLYLICCLGLLRLRAKRVAMDGEPFHAPGGAIVPLAASAIIVWMLTTLEWRELAAAFTLVIVSGAAYWLQARLAASRSTDWIRDAK
jgi:basic amino acid/polyamine antiporter, APA family